MTIKEINYNSMQGENLRENQLMMSPDILFIGTGLTSALSAHFLLKIIPATNIMLWDEAREIGGRMARTICHKDGTCTADLGAQYITTDSETISKWGEIYSPLIREGLIEEMTANVQGMRKFPDNVTHFVAPLGMNSLVKYFLHGIPKENIRLESRVIAIEEENLKFTVKSEDNSCSANVVISTMPVPQFLQLSGSVQNYLDKNKYELENVKYSSRFVLVLYYDKSVTFPMTDWALRYMDDEIFRYVSIDNRKRNRPDDPVAVIFHTSIKFGLENLEKPILEMEEILLKHAKDKFPDWPKPTATRCHKWRFSQVLEPFTGKPGSLILKKNPLLILGGDAFSESNFDGCIFSAVKIAEAVGLCLG